MSSRFAARRSALRSLGLLASFVAFGLSPAADPPHANLLSGTVRDTLGNALADVEVLVLSSGRVSAPLAVVSSDATGRFDVARLLPGAYRIAALKEGYLTFIARVDTAVQNTLQLVMRPVSEDANDPPDHSPGSSWALRLPRRGILHELDTPAPEPNGIAGEPIEASEPRSLRVDQLFAVSAKGDSADRAGDVKGVETRMSMASPLGERGNVRVDGRRESVESEGAADRRGQGNLTAASMNVKLSYATEVDSQVDFNAFYSHRDVALTGVVAAPRVSQELRTWGYDASWSKRLDPTNSIAVRLDYLDTSLAAPAPETSPLETLPPAGFGNSAVAATGTFERAQGQHHRVAVLLRAQLQRLPAQWRGPQSSPDSAPSRWNVAIDAQDAWSPRGPFTFVAGFGYRQGFEEGTPSLLVPRVGGSWMTGGWQLEGVLSYHAANEQELPAYLVSNERGAVGYEATLRIPLAEGLELAGGSSYAPVVFGSVAHTSGPLDGDGQPLWVTDGNAALHRNRVSFVESRGEARTFVELTGGRAKGTVAPLVAFDGAARLSGDRDLRYRNARVGLQVPASGTDVSLEYRWVAAESAQSERTDETEHETVEVRVVQGLSRLNLPGDWRLLLALRLGSVESATLEQWEGAGGDEGTVAALNRRVGAGVSVLF